MHSFALPALGKGKKWYLTADSKTGVLEDPEVLKNQREAVLEERTIALFYRPNNYARLLLRTGDYVR